MAKGWIKKATKEESTSKVDETPKVETTGSDVLSNFKHKPAKDRMAKLYGKKKG